MWMKGQTHLVWGWCFQAQYQEAGDLLVIVKPQSAAFQRVYVRADRPTLMDLEDNVNKHINMLLRMWVATLPHSRGLDVGELKVSSNPRHSMILWWFFPLLPSLPHIYFLQIYWHCQANYTISGDDYCDKVLIHKHNLSYTLILYWV